MNSRRRIGKLEPVPKSVINDFGLKACMIKVKSEEIDHLVKK